MSKKSKGSVLNMIEHERHRVAASITREQDWEQPEPNSGLARMFVIMLLIHVFVIGGIIIYDFVGGDSSSKTSQASGSVASSRASSNSTGANTASPPLPTIASASSSASLPAAAAAPAGAAQIVITPSAKPSPTLSVADNSPASLPRAVPYTSPVTASPAAPKATTPAGSAAPAPVKIAHANTSDPIAFKDPASGSTSSSNFGSRSTDLEPAKEKAKAPVEKVKSSPSEASRTSADKAKSSSDKPKVADKPASSNQFRPVATPSAARKALNGDSKPPAALSKKKDKDESSDPPSVKKKDKAPANKHTLTKGDTIYSLARKYKISEDTLMKANGIKNANALTVGKVITIPAAKS
ncbi:MAG: hypothetical protein JWO94_3290 [Verrucomicrobiaceae bacterium]|nr:hypothetical protein [Verrucomicrobiaceae bacterium]